MFLLLPRIGRNGGALLLAPALVPQPLVLLEISGTQLIALPGRGVLHALAEPLRVLLQTLAILEMRVEFRTGARPSWRSSRSARPARPSRFCWPSLPLHLNGRPIGLSRSRRWAQTDEQSAERNEENTASHDAPLLW